jgi:twitching motility protein PilT
MSTNTNNSVELLSLEQLLQKAQKQQVSDIHITIGNSPYYRIAGRLQPSSEDVIDELTFWNWAETIFNIEQIQNIKSAIPVHKCCQYSFGNFSISGYLTLQSAVITIRCLPTNIPHIDKLGIPEILKNTCKNSQGLVLVTGVIGSGKTTTLSSIVNYLNQETIQNIFIIEEGITFIYPKYQSLINHWEVKTHIPSLVQGVLTAMENDADVIVINEIHNRSTLDIALHAASRGVLVVANMQSKDAKSTVQEIFSFYSSQEQDFIRLRLANSLKAILSQRLVPTLVGEYKRAAIFDLLLTNEVIRSCILEGRIQELSKLMQEGKEHGMLTMKVELQKLLESGRITEEIFTETLQKINS